LSVLDGITAISGKKPIFYKIDLKEKGSISQVFKAHKIAGVIHFAASKAVNESVENPLLYYQNNLTSLVNLLQVMLENDCQNIIFSSSCTVYGQADTLPINEDAPIKPAESPYGNTKQIGEEILLDTTKASVLKAIALRYFNPIGAHHSALIGELPLGVPQNLIPFVTQTAAGIRPLLSIFGADYPTIDGTAVRDYIHVVDLANAHVKAVARLLDKKQIDAFEVFNVGTGKGTSVLQVIKTFEKVNHLKLNYKIVGRRAGDITAAYADTTKANTILGWSATQSLEDALISAWKWQKKLQSSK
ncbi:MAG: UDP-glucose 4-epimerase GalE, partial [Zetaproteobacteria bacterium]|nr:UDP-glucose 4-epimerase GalE [Flavobacteriales bacterium]